MSCQLELDLSPFQSTNDPPDALTAKLLHDEITQLSEIISDLQSQLARAEGRRRECQIILSPLRRFPLELLQDIFALLFPVRPGLPERALLMNLGLVCKRWRDATLLAPRLWSYAQLDSQSGPGAYDKAVAWLGRSSSTFRNLELMEPNPCACDGPGQCKADNAMVAKLLADGPQLACFSIVCAGPRCFRNFIAKLNAMKETMPASTSCPWDTLQGFELAMTDHTDSTNAQIWSEPDDPSLSIFKHLPRSITHLSLDLPRWEVAFRSQAEVRAASIPIPPEALARLTKFSIRCDWLGNHVLKLLRHCAHLEILLVDFDCIQPLDTLPANTPLLLLPKVRSLKFREFSTIDLLRYIKCPNLRSLDVGFWYTTCMQSNFGQTLLDFLRASGNIPLRFLRLHKLQISAQSLASILSQVSVNHVVLEQVSLAPSPQDMWNELGSFLNKSHPFDVASSDPCADPANVSNLNLGELEELELIEIPRGYPVEKALEALGRRKGTKPLRLTASYERNPSGESEITEDHNAVQLARIFGTTCRIVPPESGATVLSQLE